MPRLSDSMEEGTILKWLKSDGDDVSKGEELVEIETDKANMTYEADEAGTLEIVAQEGDTLAVGETICKLGEGGGSSDDDESEDDEPVERTPRARPTSTRTRKTSTSPKRRPRSRATRARPTKPPRRRTTKTRPKRPMSPSRPRSRTRPRVAMRAGA